MTTYILTWNQRNWDFDDGVYDDYVGLTAADEIVDEPWSTAVRNSEIEIGDRAFLLRQGFDRGIVGARRVHIGNRAGSALGWFRP